MSNIDFGKVLTKGSIQESGRRFISSLVSSWMDDVVGSKGYDGVVSCVSYLNSSDHEFRSDAESVVAWRDAVYRALYQLQADGAEGVDDPERVIGLLPQPGEFGWS